MSAETELVKVLMDRDKPRPAELAAVVRGERFIDVRRTNTAVFDIAFPTRAND
ncbi:hypothetical protein ACFVVM_32710 [Nocardia sp. NPDC058176]|uniref:hypothetical protein n=1 Tax=Nocardia sp. NPDC058176 TaxID=3346368 RepID=UPI0036DA7D15